MRLPKCLRDAVFFARWCHHESQEPAAVARLIALAKAHSRSWARSTHDQSTSSYYIEKSEKLARQIEAQAQTMGYSVTWPGLWPQLSRNGRDIDLPSMG